MVLCVCIVVGALAAQPAADDLSGPSTVVVVDLGGFAGVKDNHGALHLSEKEKENACRREEPDAYVNVVF